MKILSLRPALLAIAVTATVSAAHAQGDFNAPLAPADQAIADSARLRTLETTRSHVRVSWNGETPGVRGSIEPLRTYPARNGMICREFEEIVQLADRVLAANRLACRDDKGAWYIVR